MTSTSAPTEKSSDKVSLPTLTAMVVGSMIGRRVPVATPSGTETGVLGAIIAWTIAGTGMLMLAFVFQRLATRKPDLDAGSSRTPRFDYVGFNSAIGYWASACAGNTSYWVLITATMSAVVPGLVRVTPSSRWSSRDRCMALRLSGPAWCQGRRRHQLHRHRRQGAADPGVHRHRDHRVQRRRLRRQLLGWRRVLVLLYLGSGDRHDADHRFRVPGIEGQRLPGWRADAKMGARP